MPSDTHSEVRPRVSVLVAAYNTRDWIAEAIDSALRQEACAVEVIVIDDASTDGTGALVSECYHDEPRVRLLSQETNRGPSAARNAGLRVARGDWVAVLDADDWFYSGRLRALIDGADSHGFDMVGDEQALHDDSAKSSWGLRLRRSRALPRRGGPWHGLCIEDVLDDMTFGVLQLVVKRELLMQHGIAWDEDIRYGEDYLFLIDCILAGLRLGVIDRPYYGVRIRGTSLTADRLASQRQLRAMLDLVIARHGVEEWPDRKQLVAEAQARIDQTMRYSTVIDQARGVGLRKVFNVVLSHPWIWPRLAHRAPKIIIERLRRYASR